MKKSLLLLVLSIALIMLGACSSGQNQASQEVKGESGKSEETNDFPKDSIEVLIPYSAGGVTSNSIRILAEGAKKYIPNNVEFVMNNKPGATGSIAATSLYKAKPDGYTIIGTTHSPILLAPLIQDTAYTKDDFQPIIQYGQAPPILSASKDAPYDTFEEWLDFVKQGSDSYTYGTTGANSVAHILMQELSEKEGLKTAHVPYESGSELIAALVGGHIDGIITTVDAPIAEQSKQIFNFQSERSELYPDVPTLLDKDIDVSVDTFFGFFAHKDVPKEKINILHDAFKQALEDPEVVEQLNKLHTDIKYRSPEEFQEMLTNSIPKFEKIAEKTSE